MDRAKLSLSHTPCVIICDSLWVTGIIANSMSLLFRAVLVAWLFRMGEIALPATLAPILAYRETIQSILSAPASLAESFAAWEAVAMGMVSSVAPASLGPVIPALAALLALLLGVWRATASLAVSSFFFLKSTFLMGVVGVHLPLFLAARTSHPSSLLRTGCPPPCTLRYRETMSVRIESWQTNPCTHQTSSNA